MRVAVYTRISKDKHGQAEGTGDQAKWGRKYAEQHWPGIPVEVFEDNSLSAFRPGVRRPGFEAMLEAVQRGEIAHLWTVEQSRLTRGDPVEGALEWFELVPKLTRGGLTEVHTDRDGVLVLRDVLAGFKAILSNEESRKTSERMSATLKERAAQGRPHGSNYAFGYRVVDAESHRARKAWSGRRLEARARGENMKEWQKRNPKPQGTPLVDERGRNRMEPVPEEADAVRWACEKVLADWSLSSIARELDRRGIRGAYGGRLDTTSVRKIVTNHTIVGKRLHLGEVVDAEAQWPAIVDESTWRMVRAKLDNDRRIRMVDGTTRAIAAKHPNGTPALRRGYLLSSGLAVCGECGTRLIGGIQRSRGTVTAKYACNHKGCGGVAIQADGLEEHVVGRLFDKLDSDPGFLAAVHSDDYSEERDGIEAAMLKVAAERLAYADRLKAGRLTLDQFDVLNDGAIERGRKLSGALAELPVPAVDVDVDETRRRWPHPELQLGDRRAFVRVYVAAVFASRRIRRPTMDQVAAEVGVSRTAVGYALKGGTEWMSEARVAQIREKADEMGYRVGHYGAFDPERVTILFVNGDVVRG